MNTKWNANSFIQNFNLGHFSISFDDYHFVLFAFYIYIYIYIHLYL